MEVSESQLARAQSTDFAAQQISGDHQRDFTPVLRKLASPMVLNHYIVANSVTHSLGVSQCLRHIGIPGYKPGEV